jgi:hypothetical protein
LPPQPAHPGSSSWRNRLILGSLVLLTGLGLAVAGWQWSRTQQGRHMMGALGTAAAKPKPMLPASAPAPTRAPEVPVAVAQARVAAEAASEPVVMTDDEATALVSASVGNAASATEAPASAAATPLPKAAPPSQEALAAAALKSAETAEAEALSPREACGSRTNFALYYCMQTQCKRQKFAQHLQCYQLQQGSEVN